MGLYLLTEQNNGHDMHCLSRRQYTGTSYRYIIMWLHYYLVMFVMLT